MKPPRWIDEEAVIRWGAKRFEEIRGETECIWGVSTAPKLPSAAHEMMLGLILAEEDRKVLLEKTALPETEAGIRAAAESGWTEPLALLIERHLDLPATEADIRELVQAGWPESYARSLQQPDASGFPKVERISPKTWRLALEFVRGVRNPKTGKPTGRRGPRKKTSAEKRRDTGTHDAEDFVPVIRTYLRDAYPKQDRHQIYDLALKIAARIKGVAEPETIATHSQRGRRDRHRAP